MFDIVERLRNDGSSWAQPLFDEAASEIARLRAALAEIVDLNQIECLLVYEIDPAGNTYEIKHVDGPLAMIARRALPSGNCEP